MKEYYGLPKGERDLEVLNQIVCGIHASVGKGYLNMEILIVEVYDD